MEKIKFQSPDGTVEEFYIEEQTMIGGVLENNRLVAAITEFVI